jgi:hypothetical protein
MNSPLLLAIAELTLGSTPVLATLIVAGGVTLSLVALKLRHRTASRPPQPPVRSDETALVLRRKALGVDQAEAYAARDGRSGEEHRRAREATETINPLEEPELFRDVFGTGPGSVPS